MSSPGFPKDANKKRDREVYRMPADRKNSEARIKANNRYNAKAYDRINIAAPKGRKAEIKAHAEQRGESINGFVNRAIAETIERDKKEGEQ